MDIEGSEYFALQGMQEILSKTKLLAVEFLPRHLLNVSGVTVEEFLSVISPHFTELTIPSLGKEVLREDFSPVCLVCMRRFRAIMELSLKKNSKIGARVEQMFLSTDNIFGGNYYEEVFFAKNRKLEPRRLVVLGGSGPSF